MKINGFKKIEYAAIMMLIYTINLFPFTLACTIARKLGKIWYTIDKRRRNIALFNLKFAYGSGLSYREKEKITVGSFENLLVTIIEMARLFSKKEDWLKKKVGCDGLETLKEVKKKAAGGVLLFTAHLGNWEFSALRYSTFSPLNVIARRMDNIFLEEKTSALRTLYGTQVIHKKGALKKSLKCIRDGQDVGILIDQNSVVKEGVFVDFFGKAACTPSILAVLAIRTGAPVIPVFNIRLKNGDHRLLFLEEVKIQNSGDLKKDIVVNTAAFTKIIETFVRKYPEQWLWMHRRWKTQPFGLKIY